MYVGEQSISLENEVKGKDVDEQMMENDHEYNEILRAPEPGMHFPSLDSLYEYYRQYGRQEGFGVKKKTNRASFDGKLNFFSLSCSKAGKSKCNKQNYLVPNPLSKSQCKARINGTVLENGVCKINSMVLKHNHGLSLRKSRFFSCNREISASAKRKLELNDRAGISVAKNFHSFVVEAGGHNNVPFLEQDCRNYIDKARHLRLGVGDAEAIHDYFVRMQAKNSNFFYMMDVDDKARIKNLFWADARSRAAYEEFGDVVTFDTTYLKNKYDMPFAPFVGVNHHGQSILFGCALLSNEDASTFIWLFNTWLACMSRCAPKAIIIDQDKAMQKAIETVFPNSRHRLCLWHIMKKLPTKLRGHPLYEQIKRAMQASVYNSLTCEEFEESWMQFISEFKLQENRWLNSLYEERHRWIPAFVKDTFWAGMSTTQRSESMNSFFDGYVNSKTTLRQFVEQYDNALRDKIEKENRADFQSFNTLIPCVTRFQIEKQFQSEYTNEKFKEFQTELTGKLYCEVSNVDENVGTFDVCELTFVGEQSKEVHFVVHFDMENFEVRCACRLFEFKGILCKHTITVLAKLGIMRVPAKYIMPRWRKNLIRCHTRVKVGCDDWSDNVAAQRCDKLQKKFDKVMDCVVMSDEKYIKLWNLLDDFLTKNSMNEIDCGMNQSSQSTMREISDNVGTFSQTNDENKRLLSPLAVRTHGRPPINRKVSKVEKIVSKKDKAGKSNNKGKQIESHTKEQFVTRSDEHDTERFMSSYTPIDAKQKIPCIQEKLVQVLPPYNLHAGQVSTFQPNLPHVSHLPFTFLAYPNSGYNPQGFFSSTQLASDQNLYLHLDHFNH